MVRLIIHNNAVLFLKENNFLESIGLIHNYLEYTVTRAVRLIRFMIRYIYSYFTTEDG